MSPLEVLLYLAIALVTLLFFGPIIVIVSLIGNVDIGHLKIDLRPHGRLVRTILAIVGVGVWLSVYIPLFIWLTHRLETQITEVSLSPTTALTSSSASTLATPPSTQPITSTPICPYEAATDAETIVNLIEGESEAVNKGDDNIIRLIFAPDAVVSRGDTGESWGAITYYEERFTNLIFENVEHFDIRPAGSGISGNIAWYSSGSKGSYRVPGEAWMHFRNESSLSSTKTPYGSDHWTLEKNNLGCWEIKKFVFNAGHIQFPP